MDEIWWIIIFVLVYAQKQHIKLRTDTGLLFLAMREIYLRFLTSIVSSAIDQ